MHLCATCIHNPGRGELCAVAHRHANATPNACPHHEPGTRQMHVQMLRNMARQEFRRGDMKRYQSLLAVAHKAADEVRV